MKRILFISVLCISLNYAMDKDSDGNSIATSAVHKVIDGDIVWVSIDELTDDAIERWINNGNLNDRDVEMKANDDLSKACK